ncbi:Hypothetical_protein [Hexamita inflata]|uniref:Hypothetical_protein n=1 Tax=Hexamita inflata TaxID=28002 RepID=A0AA86PY60_9EUKA|nr:Hypothetical protein HINF_LOCUS36185 [Hexamita inflata]
MQNLTNSILVVGTVGGNYIIIKHEAITISKCILNQIFLQNNFVDFCPKISIASWHLDCPTFWYLLNLVKTNNFITFQIVLSFQQWAYKHLDSSEIVGFYKLSFMQLKNGKLVLNKISDVNNTLQACFYIVVGKEFACSEVIYQFL